MSPVGVAAAYSTGTHQRAPRIDTLKGSVRIKHRELIASVTGSANFIVANSFPLNPGMPTSFPWLASQAQAWERYRFNSLRFLYYTRTGTGTSGSVMLAPEYDPADQPPVSEQVAATYEDVREDVPWKDIVCDLNPSSLHALGPSKFIRTGILPQNLDIKTYDSGNLHLCVTDGNPVPWGKLWVEYDVTLMTPQLNPLGGAGLAAQHTFCNATINTDIFKGAVNQPGSLVLVNYTPDPNGGNMTFTQAGQFLITMEGNAATSMTHASGPTITNGGSWTYNPADAGSGSGTLLFMARIRAQVGTNINWGITLVGVSTMNVHIAQVPDDLVETPTRVIPQLMFVPT